MLRYISRHTRHIKKEPYMVADKYEMWFLTIVRTIARKQSGTQHMSTRSLSFIFNDTHEFELAYTLWQ